MYSTMAQRLLTPNPENGSILELKEVAWVGSSETALRCTAIQMLIVGISREQVCQALRVTERALRKWINAFNLRRGHQEFAKWGILCWATWRIKITYAAVLKAKLAVAPGSWTGKFSF